MPNEPYTQEELGAANVDLFERFNVIPVTHQQAQMVQADLTRALKRNTEQAVTIELLRRRIHLVERHNQFFERCESLHCNPRGTTSSPVFGNEATEYLAIPPGDPAKTARIAELEARVAELEEKAGSK